MNGQLVLLVLCVAWVGSGDCHSVLKGLRGSLGPKNKTKGKRNEDKLLVWFDTDCVSTRQEATSYYLSLMEDLGHCLTHPTNHSNSVYHVKKRGEFHAYYELRSRKCIHDVDIDYDDYCLGNFDLEPFFDFRDTNDYTCVDVAVPVPDAVNNANDNQCGCALEWHLDLLDGDYWNWDDGEYNHLSLDNAGDTNVDIYIVDTGILSTHNNFEGIAFERLLNDDNAGFTDASIATSHGTFVAGVAAGLFSGVARNFGTLYDVPQCFYYGCSAQEADEGFDLIIAELEDFFVSATDRRRAVIVMSWGDTYSEALFDSYNGIFEEITDLGGILFAATTNAALEWNAPCDEEGGDGPAGCENVVAVGNYDWNLEPSFSGFGECIDVYGPGENIMSSTSACDDCWDEDSGTSFATPAVAGMVANMLSYDDTLTFDQIMSILTDDDGTVELDECDRTDGVACLGVQMDCDTMVTLVDTYSTGDSDDDDAAAAVA